MHTSWWSNPRRQRYSAVLMLWGVSMLWCTVVAYAAPAAPQAPIASSVRAAVQQATQPFGATTTRQGTRLWRTGKLEVYVYIPDLTAEHLVILQQHGVRVLQSHGPAGVVYATLPAEVLEPVAMLPFVRWIGLPDYATRRQGSVTSEGDITLRAEEARAAFQVAGQGVRVGIISDSLTDVQAAVVKGDLPAQGVTIVNGQDGTADPDATNEGRAMAEIIHDLAPEAALFFHSGFPDSLAMVRAIEALTTAGVQIIVDDLAFFREPVFQDGAVAQAVQKAIDAGVIFVTAAGNSATAHYLAPYQGVAVAGEELHNFGRGDTTLNVRVPAGGFVGVFLQWPNLADGSANTADYDLFLVDTDGNTLAASLDRQIGGNAPPREEVSFVDVNGGGRTVGVIVKRVAGASLPLSLYFIGPIVVQEHNVPRNSIFGHPCVRGAIAAGAINANSPGFNTLEAFSSRGACEILLPRRDVRTKPDVSAADGVLTSLEAFSPFFGTSAAAPHVAAVAALMLEAGGGPAVASAAQIANTLRYTAIDGGAKGVDNSFGYGVVDAVEAVGAARALRTGPNTPPRSVIDDPPNDLNMLPNARITFQGSCLDAEAQQPFTVAWDFDGVTPPVTVTHPGAVTFLQVGTFEVTFTCTDAVGLVDPTPAKRRVIINTPPDSTMTSPTADLTIGVGASVEFAGTCADPESHTPFTFLWDFGGGAAIPTSTQQNPTVSFASVGSFRVTFTCKDALNTADPTPDFVQVIVTVAGNGGGGGGGGGGGCAILPYATRGSVSPLEALGNILLPIVVLSIFRACSRRKRVR